jgi:hypothetical protein
MAGGIKDGVLDLDDALDLNTHMWATGRMIKPSKWIESAIAHAQVEEVEGLF